MPRLTSSVTGVVVNVDDETAATLGGEWRAEASTKKSASPSTKKK